MRAVRWVWCEGVTYLHCATPRICDRCNETSIEHATAGPCLYRFKVSHATVSRIFSPWLVVMDTRLFPLISWPEREQLWRTMPQCFMYSFGKKVTVVIDCFEVFIEKAINLLARAQTFSSYKHHNTIELLICITPQNTVSYVSEACKGDGGWGEGAQNL